MYKNITIPDDDLVRYNPWRSVYLKLKSADYRVVVPENYTHAVVWIEDNEGTDFSNMFQDINCISRLTAVEPLAYVQLEDYHYSVVEGRTF